MLRQTFLFLPGVSERTEKRLWSLGIATWDHLLEASALPGVSRERLSFWKARIRHAETLLRSPDGLRSLARQLGTHYTWRHSAGNTFSSSGCRFRTSALLYSTSLDSASASPSA